MAKKKHLQVILGLSMLAGITGSFFLKNQKVQAPTLSTKSKFIGSWKGHFINQSTETILEISPKMAFFLNNHPIEGHLLKQSSSKLIFEDHYGYQLIFTLTSDNTLELYDDAEEKIYTLQRVAANQIENES